MDIIINKYERWTRWIQFIFVIFVYIGIYCILSILSYALYSRDDFHVDPISLFRAYTLLNGIGMSIVAILLFRLITLTYFEAEGVGKIKITLTAVYSQFGIYTFIYFMVGLLYPQGYLFGLYETINALKRTILYPNFYYSETPYAGWLLFGNVMDILSVTVVIILILQILYLQRSENKNIHSAAYWKVVIYLAIGFCAAYMVVISFPPSLIPITGGGPDNSPIIYITAITGLISAVSALYAQILAGKKINMEMEVLNAQKAALVNTQGSKNKVGRKSVKQHKSK